MRPSAFTDGNFRETYCTDGTALTARASMRPSVFTDGNVEWTKRGLDALARLQ